MNPPTLRQELNRLIEKHLYGQHEPVNALRFVIEVEGIGARPYSPRRAAEETCQALNFLSVKVDGDLVRFRVVEPEEL